MLIAVWILFLLHGCSIRETEAHSIQNRDTHKDPSYDLETSTQRDYVLRGSVPPSVPPITSPSNAGMPGSLYSKNMAGMLGDLYRKMMESSMAAGSSQKDTAANRKSNLYSRNIVAGMLGDLKKKKKKVDKMTGSSFWKKMGSNVQCDLYRRHVSADKERDTFRKMFSYFAYGHFPGSFPTKIPEGDNGSKGDDIKAADNMRNDHKPYETNPSFGITNGYITNRFTKILENYERFSSAFNPDIAQNPVNDPDKVNDNKTLSSDRAKSFIGAILQRSKRHPELLEELDKPRRNKLPAHIYRLVIEEWLRHRAQMLIDGIDANRKLLTPGSSKGLSVGLDIRALKLVADDRARQLRQEKLRESQDKLGLIG